MPELPEVETIRRQLAKDIVGKKIKNIDVLSAKQFIGDKHLVIGAKIIDTERTGKIMAIKLDNKRFLNIHLKMAGQLIFSQNKNAVFAHKIPFVKGNGLPAKTTRIIIDFTDGAVLFFNDLRKFGWIKVANQPERPTGIDILAKDFTPQLIRLITSKSGKPIKLLIMEQDKITGIGNIYANEALFYAGIDPRRKAKTLSEAEIKKLYQSIIKVINKGLKYNGSSAGDEAYVLPDASRGRYQEHMAVYDREGKPCPNHCGGTVERIKQGGRSTYFCPQCQQ